MSAPYCQYDHRNFLTLEFLFSIVVILPFGISTAFHSERNTGADVDANAGVLLCVSMNECVHQLWFYKLDAACVRIYIKKFRAS